MGDVAEADDGLARAAAGPPLAEQVVVHAQDVGERAVEGLQGAPVPEVEVGSRSTSSLAGC